MSSRARRAAISLGRRQAAKMEELEPEGLLRASPLTAPRSRSPNNALHSPSVIGSVANDFSISIPVHRQ